MRLLARVITRQLGNDAEEFRHKLGGEKNVKVAIIGAGISGIAAARAAINKGVAFDMYESAAHIGGIWHFDEAPDRTSVYYNLFCNTTKQMMSYSDFPFEDDIPDMPYHTQIDRYLNDYVDRHSIRDHIRFEDPVTTLRKVNNRWELSSQGHQATYDAVLVANGHHSARSIPKVEGEFSGPVLHSQSYKGPAPQFKGKRVLIVGLGNTAADIGADLAGVASRVEVSIRRTPFLMRKYTEAGVPYEHAVIRDREPAESIACDISGLDFPPSPIPVPSPGDEMAVYPTFADRFVEQVSRGNIKMRGPLARFDGPTVHFNNGDRADYDVIVFSTGYKVDFPFLPEGAIDVDNRIGWRRLYKNIVPPSDPTLFFIGLVQPVGAMPPTSEVQSTWSIAALTGEFSLPSHEEMEAEIDARVLRGLEKGSQKRAVEELNQIHYMT
ncbi:MAG: NAD(P)-binding domain-containing protein, partial [Gammaproteobacteria bacterium]|nr:NAD(P)-binding domain-containing protein [Gammaproteobacteria bacterium]